MGIELADWDVIPLLKILLLPKPLLVQRHIDLEFADADKEEAPQVLEKRLGLERSSVVHVVI